MLFVVIGLCLLYIVLQLLAGEKIYRPSVMFAILWGTILLAHSFGGYQLPQVGNETYLIIACGLMAFFIGTSLARISKFKITIGSYKLFSKRINQGAFNVLRVVFFALMFMPVVRAIGLLIEGASLYTIRYSLQNDILGTGTIAILFNYYCEPFLTFMIVYSVANFFSANRDIRNMISTIIGVITMVIISGGRFFLLYFSGALIISFLLYKKTISKNRTVRGKKVLKRVRQLIAIAIVAILLVSIIRGSKVWQTVYVYLCGGVPFFEHLKDTLVGEHTYGAATLYGFLRPIFVILRKVGICDFPMWLQNTEEIFLAVDNPYYIAPGILFNSFTTGFFAPYLDAGIAGVCIVYFILGCISERIYKRVKLENEYSVSWFLLISLVVVFSFFRLTVTHYSFALAFVYLMLTHRMVLKDSAE